MNKDERERLLSVLEQNDPQTWDELFQVMREFASRGEFAEWEQNKAGVDRKEAILSCGSSALFERLA